MHFGLKHFAIFNMSPLGRPRCPHSCSNIILWRCFLMRLTVTSVDVECSSLASTMWVSPNLLKEKVGDLLPTGRILPVDYYQTYPGLSPESPAGYPTPPDSELVNYLQSHEPMLKQTDFLYSMHVCTHVHICFSNILLAQFLWIFLSNMVYVGDLHTHFKMQERRQTFQLCDSLILHKFVCLLTHCFNPRPFFIFNIWKNHIFLIG